jgi:tRNA-specific 2-thiouridylase
LHVSFDEASRQYVLRRGRYQSKDQSYFLFSLSQAQLAQAAFPVGDMTKEAVREYAREHGLLVADKRDSYEICFVPNGDYAAFVEREAGGAIRPGVVRDTAGRVLATHDGVHHFTIGQRKGLRLSAAVPLYVTAIDAASATVTVGPRASIEQRACRVTGVNWLSGVVPPGPVRASVQIRHRHVPAPATVTPRPTPPAWSSQIPSRPSLRGRPRCSSTATRCWAVAGSPRPRTTDRPRVAAWPRAV